MINAHGTKEAGSSDAAIELSSAATSRSRSTKRPWAKCQMPKQLIYLLLITLLMIGLLYANINMNMKTSISEQADAPLKLADYPDMPRNIKPRAAKKSIPSKCKQVYFWGGGKSGSTSLWSILVRGGNWHNGTKNSPFVDGTAKELCFSKSKHKHAWEELIQNNTLCNTHGYQFLINGCPRHTTRHHANQIITYAESADVDYYFLMMIRDPVDRLVSHLNDAVRRGGKRFDVAERAESLAKSSKARGSTATKLFMNSDIHMRLSLYGEALLDLLETVEDPSKILIIPIESLSNNPQGVANDIMDHIGGERWKLSGTNVHSNSGVNNKQNHIYQSLPSATTTKLRGKFKNDVLLLERLIGKKLSWSAWAHGKNNTGQKEEGVWLTSTPLNDFNSNTHQ